MGSLSLGALWFLMPFVYDPFNLIVLYALISVFSSLITVNWYAFIADNVESATRGNFLSAINNLSSVGTVLSVIAMTFFFTGANIHDLFIPFVAGGVSYFMTAVLLARGKETRHPRHEIRRHKWKDLKKNEPFYRYFVATSVQGYFWSMAWPMFPITIISVMNFSVLTVAYLTIVSLSFTIATQYFFGRFVDRVNRVPLIFLNRIMLCMIPLMYGLFSSFPEFVLLEVYSGFTGAIQAVVMTAYLLDVAPRENRAEYISKINGMNGVVYFLGATTGGFLLQYLVFLYPLRLALLISYLIVFAGRLASSFLFLRLREVGGNNRRELGLFSILLRWKQPGSPSGGPIKPQ